MHQSCILQSAKARTGTAARIAVRPHSLSLSFSRVFYLLADSAELSRDPCVLHAKNIMKYKSVGARSRGVRGPSRDCESGKSSPCNTQRDATGAILPVIKTFGGNPAVCMGFSPTVNSRFAETYGETLRAACILFADLMNSPSLPSSPCYPALYALRILPRRFLGNRDPRLCSFQYERTSPSLATLAYRIRIALQSLPQRRQLSRYCVHERVRIGSG